MTTLASYRQFLTSEPEAQIEWRTLEISHPSLSQVYRFVSSYNDQMFTLESGAPRNAGETVTFSASGMEITEPGERQDSEQLLDVNFNNTDGTIHEIIDQISGQDFFTEVEIIYRKYFSGDTSEPAVPPLYLFASVINFRGIEQVTFTAEDADLSSKRVGIIYTIENFPGLEVDN